MFRDVQESRRRDVRSVDHVPKRRRLADEEELGPGGGQGGSWRPRTFRHADMNPAPFRHHPGADNTAPYVEYDPIESVFEPSVFADMNPAPGADNTAPYVEYGPLESVYEPSVLAGQRSASPSRHASSSQATPSSRERLAMHGSPWQGASAPSDLQTVRYGRYGGRLQSPTTGQKLSGSARGGYDQQFGSSEQQHKQQQPQPLMALDLDYHHERSGSYREASAILSEDEFQGISSEGEYEHLQYSNYGGDNDRPPLQQQQQQSTTQGDNEDADLHSREKPEINQEQQSSEELQFIVPAWKCTLCSTFASSMEETRKHEAEPGHCERSRQAKAQQKVEEILKAEIRRQEERKRLEQEKAEEVERKKQQQQQKDQAEEEEEERRKQAEVWELRRKIMELEEVHNKLQHQLLKPDHPPELTASSKQSPRTVPHSKQSSRTAPRSKQSSRTAPHSKAPLKRSPPTVPTTQSKPPSFKLENLKKHVKHKKHTTEHPRSHSVPEPKQEVSRSLVAAVKKVKVKLKRPTKTSTTATQQPINAHSSGKEPTEELYDIQVHPDTPEFDQYQPSSKETGRLPLPLHSQQPSKETGRLPQPFQSSSKETGRLPPPFQSSSKETGRLPPPFQSSSKETARLPQPFQSSSKETGRLPPPFLQPPLASRRQVWSYRQVHEDTEYRLPRLPHTTAAAATRQSSDYQHQRDFNY